MRRQRLLIERRLMSHLAPMLDWSAEGSDGLTRRWELLRRGGRGS